MLGLSVTDVPVHTMSAMSESQRGRALIIDILLIQGRVTKLGRSAKVLVGVVGVGVIFVANLTKGQRSAVIDSRYNVV